MKLARCQRLDVKEERERPRSGRLQGSSRDRCPPERHPVLRSLLLLAVACTALAGCTSDDGGPATDTTPTTTPTTDTTGIDPLAGASTDPVTVSDTGSETALLTAVRAARHEGFDRVVFQFRNHVPGYDVRYVEKPVRADGSGDVVDVSGAKVVQVRMDGALDADLGQESAPVTYTGPTRFTPDTPEVAELVRIGGFEAVLTWAIGLRDRVDFRVTELEGPPRLVVDVRNH